jgi:uncharacterized protein with von Willebrand factor type A (vWA) domain
VTDRPAKYYIYYRVDVAQSADAVRIVAQMQSEIELTLGIACSLLHRADEPQVWMEVYDRVHDRGRFEAALADLVERHEFVALLAPGSSRTVERFIAGAP